MLKPVYILIFLTCLFWLWMFSPWTRDLLPFWPQMLVATGILAIAAVGIEGRSIFRSNRKLILDIAIGVISAAALYAVFFIGKRLSEMILPFAGGQIAKVYETRSQWNLWFVGILLLLWIGPAEEIFWRGFIQQRLSRRFGPLIAFAQTLVFYTLMHIWSFNLMLLAAAFICGFVWGAMYWKFGSVRPGLVSHAVWDVLIFVMFPLN